jgi:hypothetical protein
LARSHSPRKRIGRTGRHSSGTYPSSSQSAPLATRRRSDSTSRSNASRPFSSRGTSSSPRYPLASSRWK